MTEFLSNLNRAVVYTPRPGLFADLCACLDAQSLRIIRADVSGRH